MWLLRLQLHKVVLASDSLESSAIVIDEYWPPAVFPNPMKENAEFEKRWFCSLVSFSVASLLIIDYLSTSAEVLDRRYGIALFRMRYYSIKPVGTSLHAIMFPTLNVNQSYIHSQRQ